MKENTQTNEKNGQDLSQGGKSQPSSILIVHGARYKTNLTRKYENRKKWEKPDEKQILSFIPGTVSEVFTKNGAKVKKGQKLMVLDAMKMLNDILSPMDGVIKAVHITAGDRVSKGKLMIEFE